MNTRKNYPKFKSLLIVLSSLCVLSCGSFKGASYFSNDGIYTYDYTYELKKNSERSSSNASDNGNYYSNYFKDLLQDNIQENELYFTDTENYTSEDIDLEKDNYVENPQLPWGEKTTQTEIIIFNTSPNYMWGLSGFAFRGAPFWNNYYFNNPYRFGYGFYDSPFMEPFINPYNGGYAGLWLYDPFYSPFGLYGGYGFGYGFNNWNRWNRWNRWNPYGAGYYGYSDKNSNGYGKDYISTVARVKSGRGEKNYEGTKRSDRTESQNSKNRKNGEFVESTSRINSGRGLNSLGTTYFLTNRKNNILGEKITGNSLTARPTFGTSSGSGGSSLSNSNTKLSKGNNGNSKGRSTQARYRNIVERQSPNTTSPRNVNQTSETKRSNTKMAKEQMRTSRGYKSSSSNSFSKSINRNYNRNNNFSTPSYRNSSPAPSFNSGASSRSFNSGGGRTSSGRRRN